MASSVCNTAHSFCAGFNMNDLDDDDDGLQFVHANLPSSTAEALGVPSLMGRMLDADELDFR